MAIFFSLSTKVEAATNTSSVIFDGAKSGGYYAYAPGVVDVGGSVSYFTCHGPGGAPYTIHDEIWLHQGTSSKPVFIHGPQNSWDWAQICDPSVISGNFKYNGTSYRYALFYTGAGDKNGYGRNNRVGVAFSNNLTGTDWVRFSKPLIDFQQGHVFDEIWDGVNHFGSWGVGQPSAIKMPGSNGKVLLFYQRGDNGGSGTYYLEIDLSSISDSISPVLGQTRKLNEMGLTDLSGSPDSFTNIDVAYDSRTDRYYAIREKHYDMAHGVPFPPPSVVGGQGYIVNALELVSISAADFSYNGQWKKEGNIDSSASGNYLNHNSGLRRDLNGNISVPGKVSVYYTSGCGVVKGVLACDDKGWFYNASILASTFSYSSDTGPEPTDPNLTISVTALGNNTSVNPILQWTATSSPHHFLIDFSEKSDFSWFWNHAVQGTERSLYYSGDWGSVGSVPYKAPASLVPGRTYYVRVVGFDANNALINGAISTGSFTVAAVTQPQQLSVEVSALGNTTSVNPTFQWSATSSPHHFLIDFSEKSDFSWFWNHAAQGTDRSLNYNGDWGSVGNVPYKAPATLVPGHTYYIRVVGFDANNMLIKGAYGTGSFTVAAVTQPQPLSVTVSALGSNTSLNPILQWSATSSPHHFLIDFSEKSDFSWFWNHYAQGTDRSLYYSGDWGSVGSVPYKAPTSLVPGRTYYVRVVGFDANNMAIKGAFGTGNFKVQQKTETNSISLISPMGSASLTPKIEWSFTGKADIFFIDISERSDFSWFWNNSAPATERSLSYTVGNWGLVGAGTIKAPARLVSGKQYFIRIVPFYQGQNLGATQGVFATGSFIAR